MLGKHLKERREVKEISINRIPLSYTQVKSIEKGTANYTIIAFIKYLSAIDCYHFVADKNKSSPEKPLDTEDVVRAMKKENPNL